MELDPNNWMTLLMGTYILTVGRAQIATMPECITFLKD
jgi:hypothetical protein